MRTSLVLVASLLSGAVEVTGAQQRPAASAVNTAMPAVAAAAAFSGPGRKKLPRPDSVLKLADRYLADALKRADPADKRVFTAVKTRLRKLETNPDSVTLAISGMVTQLTIALGSGDSPNGITMLSAFLAKLDPYNPRVTNLFGAVLHSTGRLRDASDVLELAVHQAPVAVLARLNLANVYIDRSLDAKAKAILDTILRTDPENRDAWSIMATYWFRRQNFKEQQTALLRASIGGVGLIKRAVGPVDAAVEKQEVQPGESVAAMERKLAALSQLGPLTSADIVERVDPRLAAMVRKEALTPLPNELWKLPLFPEMNSTTNRGYAEGMPIVTDWIKWFATQYSDHLISQTLAATGIERTMVAGQPTFDDSATMEAKGRAFADKEMAKGLQQAQDMMKFLKGAELPGVPKGQVNDAISQVQRMAGATRTSSGKPVHLANTPVDTSVPPGFDSGGPFSRSNYRNYLITTRSYERYFEQYYREFDGTEKNLIRVYSAKVAQENTAYVATMAQLREGVANPEDCTPCKREELRHLRAMNALGAEYYRLWSNLYIPDYTKRMKPMLEQYWATAVVYLRNMVDPAVASREYFRVYDSYAQYALKAGTFASDGAAFTYVAASDDELQAIEAAIRDSEVDVPAKHIRFMKDSVPRSKPQLARYKEKGDLQKDNPDWYDLLNGKGTVELNGQFLNLTLSRQKCSFRAWAFGPMAGTNWDFEKGQLETYYGLSAQFKIGMRVGNVGVVAKASADYIAQVNTIDLFNGTLTEAFPDEFVVKGSVKGTAVGSGAPVFDVSGDLKYNSTDAWSGSFQASAGTVSVSGKATAGGKAGSTASISLKEGFGPFEATGEINYTSKGGLSANTGVSGGIGALTGSVSGTASSATGVQVTAQGGASGGGVNGTTSATYGMNGTTTSSTLEAEMTASDKQRLTDMDGPHMDAELKSKFATSANLIGLANSAIKDLSLPRK